MALVEHLDLVIVLAYLALVFILRRDMLFEIIDLVIRRRAPPVPSA